MRAFLPVVERLVAHIADHHTHLGVNGPDSPPIVPSGADLWAEWKDEVPLITAVRGGSPAAAAGVPVGAVAWSVDGAPIIEAIESLMGSPFAELHRRQKAWALRTVLAGQRNAARRLELEWQGDTQLYTLDPVSPAGSPQDGVLVDSRRIESFGYIRILDALGDGACVAQFDAALDPLMDTAGLILDLRDTPSGGNTTVGRGILSRFVDRERPYQRHVAPQELARTGVARSWLELVSPRGKRYPSPVVVLVSRWTASMGEGLAVGFDAIGGKVVGGRMAGLRGAIEGFELPASGFTIRIPVERLTHIDGTPRERFSGLAVPPSASPAEIIERGLEVLRGQ